MKKSSKYNLLSKNELKKEKLQEEWVQMESASRWEGKMSHINDTSYVKLEEEYSEIEHDLSGGARNTNIMLSNNNRVLQYSHAQKINSQIIPPQIKPSKVPQLQPLTTSSIARQAGQNLKSSYNPNIPRQSTFNSQLPQNNSYGNYTNNNQQYARQSTFYDQGQRGNLNSNQFQSYQNSHVRNLPVNGGYPQYTPSQYNNPNQPANNSTYQQPNQSVMNSRQSQQYINSNLQPSQNSQINPQQSSIQPNRPNKRQSIPQMTVNCDKCTFTQSVPGNAQIYICCICNQINECFPLYGVFTCGICRANVIYPNGTSRLIKCTKCQTVNRVNPQPSKKIDQVVTMGKEKLQSEQEQQENNRQEAFGGKLKEFVGKQEELKPQNKMSRNQQEIDISIKEQHQVKMYKNIKGPFQILAATKNNQHKQQQHSQSNNMPEITEDSKPQKRYPSQLKVEFNQELIQLDIPVKESPHLSSEQNLCKQLLQLTEKLDQSLIISKEQNIGQSQQTKNGKQSPHYPSLFDF